MTPYLFPIKITLLLFPFLAFFITLPLLILNYRKYGTFTWFRAFILYSFIFYLLCAYFLVILPLPPREEVAHYTSQMIELRPFLSLKHFLAESGFQINQPSTYLSALKHPTALEPLFNILMLVPFGFYLRYYFKCSFVKTVCYSFLLSLFFELTQLSGLYFIYPRPYRLADVNDLINNTLGGIIGYWLTPLLSLPLPSRQKIDEQAYERGKRVTIFRRATALLIDYFALTIGISLLTPFLKKILPDSAVHLITDHFSSTLILIWLYFIFSEKFFSGKTLGKALVRIQVKAVDTEKLSLWQLILRYTYLYGYLWGSMFFFSWFSYLVLHDLDPTFLWLYLTCLLIALAILGSWGLILLIEIFKKRKQLYYESLSKTITVSTVKQKQTEIKTQPEQQKKQITDEES